MKSTSTDSPKKNYNSAAFAGIFALLLGLMLFVTKSYIVEAILESVLILKPNSPITKLWMKPPLHPYLNVYFFNWTNSEDFHNFSIKPKFEEVGPYKFVQKMEKVNVIWNNNDTVTYSQVRTWYFNEEESNGSLSDRVTTLNYFAVSGVHYTRNWNYILKKAVSLIVSTYGSNIPYTKTVNEFLVEGIDEPLFDVSHYVPFIEPDMPRVDRFGWLRVRNGCSNFDGVFNKAIGLGGDFQLRNWKYNNVTPYFDGSCAKVQGSEGELNSYKLSKKYIDIFVSDICRYVRLDFEEEVTVKGILGYKYSVGNSALDNGTIVPGNDCFCAGDCIPSGMINVSSCRYGLPGFASLPHFYQADSVYLNAVEGLRPNRSKHESFIVFEPTTGLVLRLLGRVQVNFWMHPVDNIDPYENVPDLFFPYSWAEQDYTIEGCIEFLLKLYLYLPYILAAVAAILTTIGVCLTFVAYKPMLLALHKNAKKKCNAKQVQAEEVPLKM